MDIARVTWRRLRGEVSTPVAFSASAPPRAHHSEAHRCYRDANIVILSAPIWLSLTSIVGLPPFIFLPRRLQRHLSVLLSLTLCLWMLASATHFHTQLDDVGTHHNANELCGFCASLPGAGAAPAACTFVPAAHRQHVPAPAAILPASPLVATASYRSRAPPAA